MDGNPGVWFEIYVHDMQRAKKFYESVFQITLEKLEPPFPEIELWSFKGSKESYGCEGALVKMDGVKPGGCGTIVYFRCEDCAVEAGRVAAAGGRIERPKFSIGQYGAIALVIDTEGNMIGLHSM